MSTRQKLGSKQAHCVIHQPVSVVSQCGAGAWLNGLASADLQEAAVHLRRVRDDALHKSTVNLLTLQINIYKFNLLKNNTNYNNN